MEADLRLTVYNRETVEALRALPASLPPARVHLKVDTGTSRQGVLPEDLEDFLRLLKESAPRVILEGLSTHYANIEDTLNHDYAEMQISRFNAALAAVDGVSGPAPVHPHGLHRGSPSLLLHPLHHAPRRASGCTGCGRPGRRWSPRGRKSGAVPDFHPVLTWKTRIVQVKTDPRGELRRVRMLVPDNAQNDAGCACRWDTRTATTGRWATGRTCSCADGARR